MIAAAAVGVVGLAGVGAAAGSEVVRITAPTSISATDSRFEGKDVIVDGVTLVVDGPRRMRSLRLMNGAVVTHHVGAGEVLELTLEENLRIDPGCAINVSGRGGGSEVGRAAAGGKVRLVVGGVLSVDGWIAANGRAGRHEGERGGDGGSVEIVATALVGEGRIVANGGDGGEGGAAGDGGGVKGEGTGVRVRAGTIRGIGLISAAGGMGAGEVGAAGEPVLEVDVAMYPEGGGMRNAGAGRGVMMVWRVEGQPEAGWALVE